MDFDTGWRGWPRRAAGSEPAHDWLHVQRVAASVRQIVAAEGGRLEVALPAALLHELFNHPKGHPDSRLSGERCADEAALVLRAQAWPAELVEPICYCIRVHSFSRGIVPETLEAKILAGRRSARRHRRGRRGALLRHLRGDEAAVLRRRRSVRRGAREPDDKSWGIDHFYKKLLKIPDGLHTATARKLGADRAAFMRTFSAQLEAEIVARGISDRERSGGRGRW